MSSDESDEVDEDGGGRVFTFSSGPSKTVARVRGRHDDSVDSPMMRSTMARTCEDSLDTPVSKVKPSSHQESPLARSTKPRNSQILSSDYDSSSEVDQDDSLHQEEVDQDSSLQHSKDVQDTPLQQSRTKSGGTSPEEPFSSARGSDSRFEEDSSPPRSDSTSPSSASGSDVVVLSPPPPVSPAAPIRSVLPSNNDVDDIIDIINSDDDDDKENIRAPTVPRINSIINQGNVPSSHSFTIKDVKDLESKIEKLVSGIAQNSRMVAMMKGRLPDGGKNLRDTITADKNQLTKLRETLAKAKESLGSAGAGSSGQGMFRKTSDSKLQVISNQPPEVQLETARRKKLDLLKSLDYAKHLPDQGASIKNKLVQVENDISRLTREVKEAAVNKQASLFNSGWAQQRNNLGKMDTNEMMKMFQDAPAQDRLYGGRMNNFQRQEAKSVTVDAMAKIHKSLETMPAEGDEEEQPESLRSSIKLFPHQKQALAWLLWRETQHPPGGILADDMGLGKTLTMISLILKHREIEDERRRAGETEDADDWKEKMGDLVKSDTTLIICPASLLGQVNTDTLVF